VDGASVVNTGKSPVSIEYFKLGSQIVPLSPFRVVQPDTSKPGALPVPDGTDMSKVSLSLPPEAVRYIENDPFSLNDFESSLGADLIQSVNVQNLLDAYDDTLKLPLDYVQVTVSYQAGNGATATAGPYQLAPRGAQGSEVSVHFLRPNSGNFTFSVTGTAFYDHQRTQRSFTSTRAPALSINIDKNLFTAQ
jgi:hypothetical protein